VHAISPQTGGSGCPVRLAASALRLGARDLDIDSRRGGTGVTTPKRVYELARELNVESKLVIRIGHRLGFDLRSASARVPAAVITVLRAEIEKDRRESAISEHENQVQVVAEQSEADTRARRLIVQAFEKVHLTGRPDWQTMTIAVLKNRLLDETERSFKETDYGSRNMAEFVRRYPDLVLLDDSTTPPSVRLLAAETATPAVAPADQNRIRSDLWTSIVDYKSGFTYVWDGVTALPVEARAGTEKLGRVLPTLNADELDSWKQEFLASVDSLIRGDPNAIEQTQKWLQRRLGTAYLPASLRTPWNQELKRRVIDRLTTWFATQGLTAPKGLLQPRSSGRDQSVGADTLRQLILRCVRIMTEDELRQLNLPPSAVLRAYGTVVPGKSPEKSTS
jgi:hypothetical protein